MLKYLKNIFSLVIGASGANVITLLAYFFLARIYSPEMFGVLGLILAVATFLAPMMNFGYQYAIALPSVYKHSRDIYWLSNFISLLSCFFLYLIFIILYDVIFIFFENSALFIIIFSPIIAFSQSFINSTKQYLGKVKAFIKVAYLTFFLAVITNFLKLFLGTVINPSAAVLGISIVASFLIAIVYSLYLITPPKKIYSLKHTQTRYAVFLTRYKELSKFRFPQEFFNSASQAVPVLLLGIFFEPAIIGFYALAKTISEAPVNLIGGALGVMISPQLAQIKNSGQKMLPFLSKSTLLFTLTGLPIYGILFLYGEQIFSIAFGPNWAQAGRIAEWLSLWFFSMYITSSVNRVSPMIKAYADDFNFALAKFFVRVLSIIGGAIAGLNIEQLIALLSICSLVLNLVYVWWFFNKTKSYDSKE